VKGVTKNDYYILMNVLLKILEDSKTHSFTWITNFGNKEKQQEVRILQRNYRCASGI